MTLTLILLGLVPLIIFAVLDSFYSLKTALIGALIAVLIEAGFSIYVVGEIDDFTIYNLFLVAVFALISWKYNSSKLFKFQPSLMSALLGAYLLFTYIIGKPFFSEFLMKYKDKLIESMADNPQVEIMLNNPRYMDLMTENTMTLGVMLFVHAAITAWAAMKLGNFGWLMSRLLIIPINVCSCLLGKPNVNGVKNE